MKFWCFVILLLLMPFATAQMIYDSNFVIEPVFTSFANTNPLISLRFNNAGCNNEDCMYVAEKQGRILLFQPDDSGGFNAPTVFADLIIPGVSVTPDFVPVDSDGERGLLGLELAPDYATTRYIYLFYSTASDQRLIRITVNEDFDGMTPNSDVVLLSGLPNQTVFHKAGDIHFHPNDPDAIFISLGDDGQIPRVRDPAYYEGKLLRVNASNGQGFADNPFYNGNLNSVHSRIWIQGLRNAFRFTFHPNPPNDDVVYISENGASTDRITWALRGSDGGWQGISPPELEQFFLNPEDTNHRIMALVPPSQTGIALITSGPFASTGPTLYVATFDFTTIPIRRWVLSGSDLDTATPIAGDNNGVFADNLVGVDLTLGPDGALYATNARGFGSQRIQRIRYIAGIPPSAAFTANPLSGPTPLEVTFTDQSSDSDGTIVSWDWGFGDNASSSAENPNHSYTSAGVYTVRLTVTDNDGLQDYTEQTIDVYDGVRLNLTGNIYDGSSLPGSGLAAASDLCLYQIDGATALSFTGGTGPNGNCTAVPGGGVINTTIDVQLTEPGLTVAAPRPIGEDANDGVQAALIGFSVAPGASEHNQTLTYYLSSNLLRGRVSNTRGEPAAVDVGVSLNSSYYEIAGGRDFSSGTPSGVNHRRDADALGYYHVPIPSSGAGNSFDLDAVADTMTATYAPTSFNETIPADTLVVHDLTVGFWSGGEGCDDLSGEPNTFNDYTSQIQSIWDNRCIGCHITGDSNSAGLDLQDNSFANLVEQSSGEVPGVKLVQIGLPGQSYLFEKVNCADPQVGTRMHPTDALPLSEQALIRDFISQLSATVTFNVITAGSESGTIVSVPAGIDCGSTCSHIFPTGPAVQFTTTADSGSNFTGWSGDCSGVTQIITVSSDKNRTCTASFDLIPPGISVTPTSGLFTDENGASTSFDVVLDTQPGDTVNITLSGSDFSEGYTDKTALVFTTADWFNPQTVTISGRPDGIEDGDQLYSIITDAATSNDQNYHGINPADVAVTNQPVSTGSFFDDVDLSHPDYAAIQALAANNIVQECSAGNFCPQQIVSRDLLAVWLGRAVNLDVPDPPVPPVDPFADVSVNDIAARWIAFLSDNNITEGCDEINNLYCPHQVLTYDQLAILLWRAIYGSTLPELGTNGFFADIDIGNSAVFGDGDFAADYIEALAELALLTGCYSVNNLYCPHQMVRYDSLALILARMLGFVN